MQIVHTKSTDGIHYPGLISEPKQKTETIIIHIHGMAGSILSNSYYPAMHEVYPKNGIAFLAGEHRGTSNVLERKTDNGFKLYGNAYEIFDESVYDIQGWINFALNKGYKKIWLQSHSLGPSKVAYYMHVKKPSNISGLIWLSPVDIIGLVHDEEGAKDRKKMYPQAKQLVTEGKGKKMLDHKLWGLEILSAETYLNFFESDASTAIFNYWSDSKWDVVNNISAPVLAITGTKDDGIKPVMNPHKAMDKLKVELKNSPKVETIVYEGAEHSFEGFENKIVEDVVEFVSQSE